MTVKQLREKYVEAFGEATRAGNKVWLARRIAWRLQARAEGGLSERAKQRALELADDADLRVVPPRESDDPARAVIPFKSDGRLPPPGSVITRPYKGVVLQVRVLADGFEYAEQRYRSLSAVAKAITGSHCNGFLFFNLNGGAA
jgi:hypothetical protein